MRIRDIESGGGQNLEGTRAEGTFTICDKCHCLARWLTVMKV